MSIPPSRAHRTTLVLICIIGTILGAVGCSSPWDIHRAKLSSDERTLTVELSFGAPDSTGAFCEKITGKGVTESSSEVIVEIDVDASCRRSWPWEKKFTNLPAHVYPVPFKLANPLGERVVIDKNGRRPITIIREATVSR